MMKKNKMLINSIWVFLLGFLLMMMNLDLLYWSTPQASEYVTEEEHEQDKRKMKWTMALAFSYVGAGFLALVLQTFVL